jgi:hypothetical protein
MNLCRYALLHQRLVGFLWMDCAECLGLVAVMVGGFMKVSKILLGKMVWSSFRWFPAVCSM